MRVTIGATIAAAAAFACLFGYSVAPAGAHKGASGIVKERMDDMKLLKTSMKALSKVVQGKLDFSQGLAVKHGRQIAAVAARMPERFPHGTNAKPSEALELDLEGVARIPKIRRGNAGRGRLDGANEVRQRVSGHLWRAGRDLPKLP